jgi:hypothetical protein
VLGLDHAPFERRDHDRQQRLMARAPEVALAFGDGAGDQDEGQYLFRLNLKQVEELQEKCDAGPPAIMQRLMSHTWLLADIRETLRLGLIGGGLEPAKALKLVQRYVDEEAYAPNALLAIAVLQSRLFPFEDDPPGKAPAAGTPVQTDGSTSPPSED